VKRRSATVAAHLLSDFEPGVWCDRCLLPSAIGAHFALTVDAIPDRVFPLALCLECGHEWSPR
jgi:hypothetical protein